MKLIPPISPGNHGAIRYHAEVKAERKNKTIVAEAFEQAAALIRSPKFTLDAIWDNASQAERRAARRVT